jgi:hypothetical protein
MRPMRQGHPDRVIYSPPIPLPKASGTPFRMILYAPFTSAVIRRP